VKIKISFKIKMLLKRSFSTILGEAVVVGIIVIAFNFFLDQFAFFNNKNVPLKMFLIGFLSHVTFEVAGLNESYCDYAEWK